MEQTVAVLGVGRVGAAFARTAIAAGYTVHVAASGPAEDIELLAEIVMPGARAMVTADAVRDAGIVVLAVPLHKYRSVDAAVLAGKIVIDVMNYWAPIDGVIDEFELGARTSSEVVAEYFGASRIVRTLNHIGYHELEEQPLPRGSADRRALAVASDDAAAADEVMALLDRLGFDTVFSGPLASSAAFAPGSPIFNGSFTVDELRGALGHAMAGADAR